MKEKEHDQLKAEFASDFMRNMPDSVLTFTSLGNLDVLYQDTSTYSARFNYPECYAIGIKNNNWYGYNHVFTIKGINFSNNQDYLINIQSIFKSDSTHLSTIWIENDRIYCSVERLNNNRFWPWKIYSSPLFKNNFEEEKSLNDSMFSGN